MYKRQEQDTPRQEQDTEERLEREEYRQQENQGYQSEPSGSLIDTSALGALSLIHIFFGEITTHGDTGLETVQSQEGRCV